MKTDPCPLRRRGIVLVLVAVLLVVLFGVAALALDIGYLYVLRADLQATADAAALAGASGLLVSEDVARERAKDCASKNFVDGKPVVLLDSDIEVGLWDPVRGSVIPAPAGGQPHAVKVTAHLGEDRGSAVDLFFGGVLGRDKSGVTTDAVAVFGSRDIVVVLDLSGSMNDDSLLGESRLTRDKVIQNLRQISQKLDPSYGTMGTIPFDNPIPLTGTNDEIKRALGLVYTDSNGVTQTVPYPYPEPNRYPERTDTWDNYINYIKRSGTPLANAGYRNRYGYLTLMNYWLTLEPKQPDINRRWNLWKTREQPISSLKDALSIFMVYMREVETEDHLGLVAYTNTDGLARLEVHLDPNFSLIDDVFDQRQAAHYHSYTNIAAGIDAARTELKSNGRPGTFRMIVLLTDGQANWNRTYYDEGVAKRAVLEQARLAARPEERFPILTISLGADADRNLMQQVADITGGVHFPVQGGSNDPNAYKEQLTAVFAQIAAARPQRLVD